MTRTVVRCDNGFTFGATRRAILGRRVTMKLEHRTMDTMKAGQARTQVIRRIHERIQAERSAQIQAEERKEVKA